MAGVSDDIEIIVEAETNWYEKLGKQSGKLAAPVAKRAKGGHGKTPMGFCLLCFREGKQKFWLARGNASTLSNHLSRVHKNQSTKANDVVPESSPLAAEAMKEYKRRFASSAASSSSRNQEKRSGGVTSVQSEPPQTQKTTCMDLDVDSDLTMAEVIEQFERQREDKVVSVSDSQEIQDDAQLEKDDAPLEKDDEKGESSAISQPSPSEPTVTPLTGPIVSGDSVDLTTVVDPTSSRNMGPIFQSSLDSFLPSLSEKESGNITNMPFNIEDLAEKIANRVVKKLGPQYGKKEKTSAIPFNPSAKLSLQSSNLIELLDEVPDFELLFEENSRVLRCSNCAAFLSSPQASYTSSSRRPSGKADGSLASGLHLSDDLYKQLTAGKCD
ncbi:Hypothetical predicted protein [Paramuricea clavata]|uniref:Uncharacterized protein n=1 Tax=Paramuricea clavata TaxID=317549 RepID=A0A6S7FZB3_PARCT|nr:Hypothetical predicted protein [Paramuricea clavata]